MALLGTAFMIMWHDIAGEGDADYNAWHTLQHMPERLDHPGFLRSRRGVNRSLEHQVYFTLYEGEVPATFHSPEYARSLNQPTDWTRAVAPHFRNFLRTACTVLHSSGRGVGGALLTSRFRLPGGMSEDQAHTALASVLAGMAEQAYVCGTHLAGARPEFSDQATSETQLRPPMDEPPFDLVLIVETIGLAEAEALQARLESDVAAVGFTQQVVQAYDVAYTLRRRDAE
jgi:hypothetical protein